MRLTSSNTIVSTPVWQSAVNRSSTIATMGVNAVGNVWMQWQRLDRLLDIGLGVTLVDLPHFGLIGRDVELEPNPLRAQLFPACDFSRYQRQNRIGGCPVKHAGDEIL